MVFDSVPDPLEPIQDWCEDLDREAEITDLELADGSKATALEIEHGDHFVWAIPRGETVDLVYPFYLTDDEVARFEDLDPEELDQLLDGLEMVLLVGRSAYDLIFDKHDRFVGFTMTQTFVPDPGDPHARQRLADGIQELIVSGLRGGRFLGVPWEDQGGFESGRMGRGGGPYPGMYG